MYRGNYQYGKKNGYGEFIWSSIGQHYQGQMKDNMLHGFGKLIWGSKNSYEGEWYMN